MTLLKHLNLNPIYNEVFAPLLLVKGHGQTCGSSGSGAVRAFQWTKVKSAT